MSYQTTRTISLAVLGDRFRTNYLLHLSLCDRKVQEVAHFRRQSCLSNFTEALSLIVILFTVMFKGAP